MSNHSNENNGYKYTLNVVDIFSKYAWSKPSKRKVELKLLKLLKKRLKILLKFDIFDLSHTDKGCIYLIK